jgi:hypothetical protein
VIYKTSFGFDDRIYWTFIQLVATFHKSVSSTGHSTSDHTTLIHSSWSQSQSQSYIATDGRSVSLGVEPHLGLMTRYFHYCLTVTVLLLWGGPSDERAGLLPSSWSQSHSLLCSFGADPIENTSIA